MSNEEQKSITPGIYLWLIAVNIYISMFAFGGGYVVVPLVRRSFVEKKKIFTEDELMEMSAVAQSSPGAIAVNLAALSGYKAAGTAGAVISCAASVIPPLVILGIISGFYDLFIANKIVAAVLKGMQSGVAALIVSVVADMCTVILKEKSFFLFSLIPIAFIANFIFDVNVALILAVCCGLCILRVYVRSGGHKWKLFLTFLKIGLVSIGGGYAVIPSIHEEVVVKAGWIGEKVFADIITISQMTPGPLAVNTSTFVGLQIAGAAGAVVATVGCVFCGVAISLTLYRFFQKHKESVYIFETLNGLKAASLGLIVSAAATIILLSFFGTGDPDLKTMKESLDIGAVAIFGGVLFLSRKRKINPIMLMLVSGAAGIILYM